MNVLNVAASEPRRVSLSGLALCVASAGWIATTAPATAATTTGLTNVLISTIAVSPLYEHTGLVAAEGFVLHCSQSCSRFWVSHDGGASWGAPAAHGYRFGTPLTVAVDGQGRESIFAPSGSSGGFQSSADGGQTWTTSSVKGR